MRLQQGATSILEKTSRLLQAKSKRGLGPINEPFWYKVVAANPPSYNLALKTHNLKQYVGSQTSYMGKEKTRDDGHKTYVTRNKTPQKFAANARHLYRPRQIRYFEDKVRNLFYTQHPWELARPKMLVENDGRDADRQDWSNMDQKYKRLDGEHVVRRVVYLLEQGQFPKHDWLGAYDKARLEFYRLRMREESDIQVAHEEALMTGASFGQSYIEHGFEQEQKVIEKWKIDAAQATQELQARMSGNRDVTYEDDDAVTASAATIETTTTSSSTSKTN